MHQASARFWRCLESLPEPVQKAAIRAFAALKQNPDHPSLNFKKAGKYWSARIGLQYRALAVEDGADFIWVWIGTHDDYERMIGRG